MKIEFSSVFGSSHERGWMGSFSTHCISILFYVIFYFLAERISVFNIPEVFLMLILGYDGGNGDQVLFMIDLDKGVPQSSIKQA